MAVNASAPRSRVIKDDTAASAAKWLSMHLGQHGVTSVEGVLTPAIAQALLSLNPDNRKVSDEVVEKYARDIASGAWEFNGEPVIVSDDGRLNDGQHRCLAVVKAGVPIRVIFVFGVKRDTRYTLDQGKMRLAGDFLGMRGYRDPVALAAVSAYLWQYHNHGLISAQARMRPTKGEALKMVEDHPLLALSLDAIDTKGSNTVGGRALLAFCHYVFATRYESSSAALALAAAVTGMDAPPATAFMTRLTGGAGLATNDPILYVRNRLITERGRLRPNEKAELIFRGWNAHRRKETPKTLPILSGKLPSVEG